MADSTISISEAARRSGVPESTLKRWASQGVVDLDRGDWTPRAAAQARLVARMRERGYSIPEIKGAVRDGRLATGSVEDLLPGPTRIHSRAEAAARVDLEEELVERILALLGTPMAMTDRVSDDDVEALEQIASVLRNGFPLVALLQLIRVYAQSVRKIAEAEVRLFHLFVHEPMIRDGIPPIDMADDMESMASELLPTIAPFLDYIHKRYLRFYMEQDVVGHMEADLPLSRTGPDRVMMTFCFVDLTGFTRYTEEEGDEEALDTIERFVETVEATLPVDATIVKTIGDEVMFAADDGLAAAAIALDLADAYRRDSDLPGVRVGLAFGPVLSWEGDLYGPTVNLASRLVNLAHANSVLVSDELGEALQDAPGFALRHLRAVNLQGIGRARSWVLRRAKE